MNIQYQRGNVLEIHKKGALVNFISSDYVFPQSMFNTALTNKYDCKHYLETICKDYKNKSGIAIKQKSLGKTIYHLTLKNKYWETIFDRLYLERSLEDLKNNLIKDRIKTIYIFREHPLLEVFTWEYLRNILEKIFKDTDITIIICSY